MIKEIVHGVRVDLYQSVLCIEFFLEIGMAFLLFLSTGIFIEERQQTIPVFELLLTWSFEEYLQYSSVNAYAVFKSATGSWISLFIPILASFSIIPLLCDERASGMLRFQIIRQRRISFSVSKVISGIICGGLAVSIGYVLYGIIVFLNFPQMDDYPKALQENIVFSRMLLLVFMMFLYGGLYTLPALLLSSFIHNKYIILCIPFVLKYLYDQGLTAAWSFFVHKQEFDLAEKLNLMSSDGILQFLPWGKQSGIIILVQGIFMCGCIVTYLYGMNRRFDCGA